MVDKIKKTTAMVPAASDAALAQLREEFPQEDSFNSIQLPRLGLVSQDITEEVKNPKTKKKEIHIITEAGTFFIERQGEEKDEETGALKWERHELGTEGIEGIILFRRYQLRMYDENTELYTSSPVYDDKSEVIPLFCDKKEVGRGTPDELRSEYEFMGEDGKVRSKLEENRILYVLYDGEVYQMNLRGSSMYAFMTYSNKILKPQSPNEVVTSMTSEAREKGTIKWNQMKFEKVRTINANELDTVLEKTAEIKQAIAAKRGFFGSKNKDAGEEKEEALKSKQLPSRDF